MLAVEMFPMLLTDTAICKASPREKSYRYADGGSMYLEVMSNGSKYWQFKYRVAGKEKRLALGVYPAASLARSLDSNNEKLW